MIRRIFCITIIALGSFLDIYFYAFRFTGDGMLMPIALITAVSLEILLAFAVYNAHTSYWFVAVAVAVTIYATIQTSAGQTFALLSYVATTGQEAEHTGQDRIAIEAGKNLDRLAIEADTINKQLQSLSSVESRYMYANTISNATNRLNAISKERTENFKIISDQTTKKSDSEKSAVKNMSIYDFYASMPRWSGLEWLKFIFHTILSAFIALMTPIGILTWNKKGDIVRLNKIKASKSDVEKFVFIAWYKIRGKTGNKILSEVAYNDLMQRNAHTVTIGVYQELFKKCIELDIIKEDGEAVLTNEKEIIELIMK